MKRISITLSLILLGSILHAQNDTFQIYFNLGDSILNTTAKNDITRLINNRQITVGQQLIILGYADYLGSDKYNIQLSRSRAQKVKEHIIEAGFNYSNITICIGKGKIDRHVTEGTGHLEDRKVQIITSGVNTNNPAQIRNTNQFDITGLQAGDIIPLNRIFFNFGTAEMTDSSYLELGTLTVFLKNKSIS